MKLSELTVAVGEVSAQLTKVQGEIIDKITALELALQDVELPDEAITALDALRAQAQVLDDIVPDVIPDEPVTE